MKLLFLLFAYTISFSQDLESIRKLDTIYVYFNYGKYEKYGKKENLNIKSEFLKDNATYAYSLDDFNTIYFFYKKYNGFDDFEKGIKTDVKKVKKKFLRKNKEKILDIHFFLRNGFSETFNALYVPRKVIYLIDSKEIKGRYVILKEIIRMAAPSYTPE